MSIAHIDPAGLSVAREVIAQAVVIEDPADHVAVVLSGQVADDADGNPVGLGDHRRQAVQIAHNLDLALAAVGGSRADLVRDTVYVVGLTPDLGTAIYEPLRSGLEPGRMPTSTLVGISALFSPDYLIEVTAEAVIPRERYTPAGQ